MAQRPHRLVTLGRLALVDADGVEDPIGKRRRKLALLATLAMTRRPISRDMLVDLFWGEQPEERARHSLSDALSHLRSILGREAIASRQAEVALTDAAALEVDAIELQGAASAKDHARVVALYGGPFLDGIYVEGSPRFEGWVERERGKLQRLFVEACAVVARERAAEQRWAECAELSRRWIEIDPASSDAGQLLLQAVRANGTPESLRAARDEYELLARRLRADLELEPAPEVAALAERIRQELDTVAPAVVELAPIAAPVVAAPNVRGRARRGWIPIAAGIVLAALGTRVLFRRDAGAAESARQVVAILDARAPSSDTSVAWLRDGFAQMLATSLDRAPTLEIVPRERVRSALQRDASASPDVAARRLGARWIVDATVQRIDQAYLAAIDVRDARDGSHHEFSVSGTNVLAVADEAAARIRGFADAAAPGPHLADLETANVDAFEHFVRSNQAADEGRFTDMVRELDAAIAADSGFTSALVARMRYARYQVDTETMARLAPLYARSASRITRWDALEQAQYLAFHNGEHARAEQLARELVATFPHDPRAYQVLATTLALHAKRDAADSVLYRSLQLDSLAIAAGHGPCAPCGAYAGSIENHLEIGDLATAERDARRWLSLQSNLPMAWAELATVLAFGGRYDDALEAERRASQLAGDDPEYAMRTARILVMARRLDAADSLVRGWPTSNKDYLSGALDLEAVIARERGQYHAAEKLLRRMSEELKDGGMLLVHASQLGQLGRYDESRREFEAITPHGVLNEPNTPVRSLAGDRARSFAWHHALEADAIAASGDTVLLAALADSIERIGARSYFARDWGLGAHVRGILDLRRGDARGAIAELSKARFGVAGWTRTNVWLARAYESAGDPGAAVKVLRDGYLSPPDAMGRYLTRSELDYEMARAFARAKMRDSAAVYASYALRSWEGADDVRSQVAELRAIAR